MKPINRLSGVLFLLVITITLSAQSGTESAILCGKVLFEPDSIYPLKPYSIIVEKDWPITFSQFEQQRIDTTDYSFSIRMEPEELTYGNIIINFFSDVDTISKEERGHWMSSQRPDIFVNSDGMITEYASRILFTGLKFVLEPGDSLHMLIDYNKKDINGRASVHFSGSGSANNKLCRSMSVFGLDSRSFRLPLKEGLSYEDDELAGEMKDLYQAKDSISEAYFRLLHTDILFDNLSAKHTLIRASLYSSDISIEEKRAIARSQYSFLDTLTLKPEYLNSADFRGFLNFYLEYINRIITGRDVPYDDSDNNSFLARSIFEVEILKTFLFERLKWQMELPNFFKTRAIQYKSYMEQFPGTPESYRLMQIYKKRFPVSNGQPAPELLLIDSLGKTRHLSDLKGKVVLITRYFPGPRMDENKIEKIEALRKAFKGSEIAVVALSTRFKEPGDFFSPWVDYYVRAGPNENLISYQFLYQSPYTFIIRKNGIIEDCLPNLNIPEESIEKLRSESYTLLTRLDVFAQNNTRGIIVVLSILLSLTLVFILRSRLKQRQQLMIKKQLNSELKAIRSQLNPHFLFNSLNSLQNFINKSDTKTANLHLIKFSRLMRQVIEFSEKESISLQEEMEFNRTFIELEQIRYGFKYTFEIEDKIDLFNIEIPSMIIQPFIENAIVHCMAELGEDGTLDVIVKEAGMNTIYVEIADNGKGFQVNESKGFGLRSSRERIDLINSQNKEKIELHIESSPDTGTGSVVKLIIPKKL